MTFDVKLLTHVFPNKRSSSRLDIGAKRGYKRRRVSVANNHCRVKLTTEQNNHTSGNRTEIMSLSKFNTALRICTRNYGFTAIRRDYGPEAVEKLRGSLKIEHTLARRGAERLWQLINRGDDSYVNALGAMTGK